MTATARFIDGRRQPTRDQGRVLLVTDDPRVSAYGAGLEERGFHVAGEWGGTGHTFDWSLARRTREAVARLFLAGGLRPDNVADAVAAVRPYAVDVCSGVETSPGRKSPELMRRFVERVKSVFSF